MGGSSVVTLRPGFRLTSATVKVSTGIINIQGNVTIGNQGVLNLYETGKSLGQSTTGRYSFYGLSVMNGGTLVFNTSTGTDSTKVVQMAATTVDLRSGGWITADYTGYKGAVKLGTAAYGTTLKQITCVGFPMVLTKGAS